MITPRPPTEGATRWWARPPVVALLVTLLLLALPLSWSMWRAAVDSSAPSPEAQGLPWQIRLLDGSGDAGGSEVFALRPGRTTLAQVMQRFGDDARLALADSPSQALALEAFVESFEAGAVQGKLVLVFDADAAWLDGARARATRHERAGDGTATRHALAEPDLAQARSLPLVSITFLPAARLDEATLTARFGAPAQRVPGAQGEVQLLYPALGVAITVPPQEGELARAKAVIQYVAPRDFDSRLRSPLMPASGPSAAFHRLARGEELAAGNVVNRAQVVAGTVELPAPVAEHL